MQILFRLLFVLILASCSSTNKKIVPSEKDVFHEIMENKFSELAEYAQTHSAISYKNNPSNKYNNVVGNYNDLPQKLNILADVKYYGNARTLLKSLAQSFNFDFVVNGKVPTRPIDVYIDDKNTRLIDILFHIGTQLSNSSTVSVNINRATDDFSVALKFRDE